MTYLAPGWGFYTDQPKMRGKKWSASILDGCKYTWVAHPVIVYVWEILMISIKVVDILTVGIGTSKTLHLDLLSV